MKLTARQIERLVKQGEVVHTECKDASGGLPDALWESYSSFANALIHADYHGRRGIVIEKQAQTISFANPGIFRVNKAVAVEGGTSDARNAHIFNIFALVDIGERSGTGLADLYGHWKKNKLPAPVITEEYDPDRVKITVYTDSDQDPTKTRTKPDQDPTKSAPEVPQVGPRSTQESAQGAPSLTRNRPKVAQDPTKTRPSPDQSARSAPEVPQKFESIYNNLTSAVKQVYRSMCEDASLTHRGMESKLGLSKTTIRKATATLIKLGMIKRVGSTKGGHWEVVK